MTFTRQDQGKVVVERDGDAFIVMFPDGAIQSFPNEPAVQRACSKWFKANLTGDIGIGQIEWR